MTALQPMNGPAVARVAQQPKDQICLSGWMKKLAFGMSAIGCTAAEQRAAIQPLLEQVQLLVSPERHPNSLSGGQLQRLMIASHSPQNLEILCLDEPLAHLDLHGTQTLLELLTQLSNWESLSLWWSIAFALCRLRDLVFAMSEGRLKPIDPNELPPKEGHELIVSHPPHGPSGDRSDNHMSWAYPKGCSSSSASAHAV